jgi:hypothetical protein
MQGREGTDFLSDNGSMPGKRAQLDDETWLALDVLSRDSMMSFQEFRR